MKFTKTKIPDVLLINPRVHEDERGFFMESFHNKKFSDAGIKDSFVQDNHSSSMQGVLRGLHYQLNQTQGKLIRVVMGKIFDVAVDLRQSSPTFGHWTGEILSDTNQHQLWIPKGFAHGFYVLSLKADVIYKTTDYYDPKSEHTLLWNDHSLGIDWPLLEGLPPLLSEKDLGGKLFTEADKFN